MPQLSGIRKTTALILQTYGYPTDLLSEAAIFEAASLTALSDVFSLLRVALQPVDLRAGGKWFGQVLTQNKSVIRVGDNANLDLDSFLREGLGAGGGEATPIAPNSP